MTYAYEKNPQQIYEASFSTIEKEADLSGFDALERAVAIRMIHACGMVELASHIVMSPKAVDAGLTALRAGADVICDVEMVRRGIIQTKLPLSNRLECAIGDPLAAGKAKEMGNTKSAAAMALLADKIVGSIVVIGNAPTALFYLLEMLAEGGSKPALIIGCPVGFVGAVESKEALGANDLGVPFITVRGRLGGSAIAAAALNALSILAADKEVSNG